MKPVRQIVLCLSLVGLAGLASAFAQDELPDLDLPTGEPARSAADSGYMGMTVDLMAPEGKSVYIVSVAEGGPAAKGGLKANDVIMEINRQLIGGLNDLDGAVKKPAGTTLDFKVRRDDVPQRFRVVLGARPAPERTGDVVVRELPPPVAPPASSAAAPIRAAVPGTDGGHSVLKDPRPQLGVTVADAELLSEADKRRLGVTVDSGALIRDVKEGQPAARAGLPIGGVIVSINGKRIGNAKDIYDQVRTFRPGQQVEVTYWDGDRMGRKDVRVGATSVAVDTGTSSTRVTLPGVPRELLRRRAAGERPILNAVEQILDSVLPPGGASRPSAGRAGASSESMVPPPPPGSDPSIDVPEIDLGAPKPATPAKVQPTAELPPPVKPMPQKAGDADQLRKQAAEMQKQLEILLRKIEELEKNKSAGPTG